MSQRAFLYMLQKVDSQIDEIDDNLSIIEKKLNSNEEIIEAKNKLSEMELQFEAKNKEIKTFEVKSFQIVSKIKTSRDRLYGGKIKNPKELEDIQVEITTVSKNAMSLLRKQYWN